MATMNVTVVNGALVPDGGLSFPVGTKLRVTVLPEPAAPTADDKPKGSLAWLLEFAGTVPDLPADFAAEHDHYIHGTPRRSEVGE